MWLRYSGSTAAGAIVTAALIYGMQLLVADGGAGRPPRPALRLPPHIDPVPPPPPRQPRQPPEAPAERTSPPETTDFITLPTIAAAGTAGPVMPTGRISPPLRPGDRRGPFVADTDLMLVAEIRPDYPQTALMRELEGSVVVEFTVTKRGTVERIEVIASTNPLFERAAVRAVARFRYRPRIVDGTAVDVPGVRAEISFELAD